MAVSGHCEFDDFPEGVKHPNPYPPEFVQAMPMIAAENLASGVV